MSFSLPTTLSPNHFLHLLPLWWAQGAADEVLKRCWWFPKLFIPGHEVKAYVQGCRLCRLCTAESTKLGGVATVSKTQIMNVVEFDILSTRCIRLLEETMSKHTMPRQFTSKCISIQLSCKISGMSVHDYYMSAGPSRTFFSSTQPVLSRKLGNYDFTYNYNIPSCSNTTQP